VRVYATTRGDAGVLGGCMGRRTAHAPGADLAGGMPGEGAVPGRDGWPVPGRAVSGGEGWSLTERQSGMKGLRDGASGGWGGPGPTRTRAGGTLGPGGRGGRGGSRKWRNCWAGGRRSPYGAIRRSTSDDSRSSPSPGKSASSARTSWTWALAPWMDWKLGFGNYGWCCSGGTDAPTHATANVQ